MTDDDLRRAIRHHAASGELPPGFVETVVDQLSERSPRGRPPLFAWLAGVAIVAVLAVGVAAWGGRLPAGGPEATASAGETAGPSAAAVAIPGVDEDVVLSLEGTPGGMAGGTADNEVVFRLTSDGRVDYVDYDFGVARSEPRVAYLNPDQVAALVEWAIGPGGIGEADTLYERASRGPAGHTVITLQSDALTKQIVYQLPPGNLVTDPDPTLGTLGALADRLSHFSDDVEAGNAVGGHSAVDDDVARVTALSDPRLRDVLERLARVERVFPDETRVGHLFVEVSLEADVAWPLDTCDIDHGGRITGAIWLVEADERRIAGVSPMWGRTNCLFDESAARWVEREWPAYSYVLESDCGWNFAGRFRIEVRDGVVVAVDGLDEAGNRGASTMPLDLFPTMAGLLDMAADARASGADIVNLVIDPEDGHPVSLEIDWVFEAVDDEACFAVEELAPQP
ncbi:MAG TPA: DUF6174 domain-containing protein [Candidatus Limnocylindria bacterium]|nr:DUF6174 domain-containing protein [Candidatus Limnocylindria bacterium]